MSRTVILVDWSGSHFADFQLLRTSLACEGRSLPLMSYVVPSSPLGNPDIHAHSLDSLFRSFSSETEVLIVADACFQGGGFRQIRSHGCMYICRVLGTQYYKTNGAWEKVTKIIDKASCTPVYLGNGLLGRDKSVPSIKGIFIFIKAGQKGASLNVRKTGQSG